MRVDFEPGLAVEAPASIWTDAKDLKTSPLHYGMAKSGSNACSCLTRKLTTPMPPEGGTTVLVAKLGWLDPIKRTL